MQGLTSAEALARLQEFGPNRLARQGRRTLFGIAFGVMRQPMFAMLLAAGLIYLLLGEPLDSALLLAFALLSVSITIVQETRSDRVLDSLRELASPHALVVREGTERRIPGGDVVPGDLVVLGEGERVPADATVITAQDLAVDESILTGESVPVQKHAPGLNEDIKIADPSVISGGTLVVRGTGTALVTATGSGTELGKIGKSLDSIDLEQPKLQQQLRWLIRDFGLIGLTVAICVVLLLGWKTGTWLPALLSGIAVSMSTLPEEFPLVLAVFLAMGAWRISRVGVLTRRGSAIETLGSATILCVDKTGTLTQNLMKLTVVTVGQVKYHPGQDPLSPRAIAILSAAALASPARSADPMESAIRKAATDADLPALPAGMRLEHTFGLRPNLFAVANTWTSPGLRKAFVKGAPEAVIGLANLDESERMEILLQVDLLAMDGVRVLAVAETEGLDPNAPLPAKPEHFAFRYLGLIGFVDPLREKAPEAVAQCQKAGIRVVMITGDHPVTASAIARQAGIEYGRVLTGSEVDNLSDDALDGQLKAVSIYSRIRPAQKLRIIERLKANGEIVAMTGDGVNDGPAIKAAHIGIAMGKRGTDVAREAASLVLLDDDFVSLVATIRLGRRIYDNIRKAIQYVVVVHIPIAGLAILPLLLGLPPILAPIQIAFMEMIIDPACSIVFESEPEEVGIMSRPPRRSDTPIFARPILLWTLFQGLAAFLTIGIPLAVSGFLHWPYDHIRSLSFSMLVMTNLSLIFVNRSLDSSLQVALRPNNVALWILSGFVLTLLASVLYFAPARALFHFGDLHKYDLPAALLSGLLLFLLMERAKTLLPRGIFRSSATHSA
jgi:Ca2+-transporting ATPase